MLCFLAMCTLISLLGVRDVCRSLLEPARYPQTLTMEQSASADGEDRTWFWWKTSTGAWIQIYHSLWRTLELKAREHGPAPELTDSSTGTPSESSAKKRSRADS